MHIPDLNSLDLGGCDLEEISPAVFKGLRRLKYLRLEGNRLRTLAPSSSFPPKVRYVSLKSATACVLMTAKAAVCTQPRLIDRSIEVSPPIGARSIQPQPSQKSVRP